MNTLVSSPSLALPFWIKAGATWLLMTFWSLLMLIIAILTLFQTRRFNTEVMARILARIVLRLWGLKLMVHSEHLFPQKQTIYISNHSSTIDLFVLIAMGLPNTRYFLKGRLRWVFPLSLIAMLIGTFFTYPQTEPQKRIQCFQRAAKILRRTGESVYLSPEGTRVTSGEIGPFNKGAFHLATDLHAPIVPLYIRIPRHIDPGKGLNAGKGTIEVFVQQSIATASWQLSELEQNRTAVRDVYLQLHQRLRAV